MGYPARIEIMGAPIDPYTMEQTVSRTKDFVETGVFAHLAGVNADKLLQMRSDQTMDRMIRQCEIVNADGASMVMAARRLGIDIPERVAGIDLMHELCRLSQSEGYRIFLLGATRDTVETARRKLEESYPGLDICGISGSIPRAPLWMQRMGLEWLFRMMKEPKRLMRRYVMGNARFMRLVSREIRSKERSGK